MKKHNALLISLAVLLTSMLTVTAADVVEFDPATGSLGSSSDEAQEVTLDETTNFDTKTVYYPNATLSSVISKYKNHNYTGCIQEVLSLVQKDPSNAAAYYYLGMAYANIGDGGNAIKAYNKVIALNTNPTITDYALKGKDCLTGGPLCHPEKATNAEGEEETDIDKLIKAPYGNGLSPEVNMQIRQKELNSIHRQINKKDKLDNKDIQRIENFDKQKNNTSSIEDGTLIASATPSDEDVLAAIKTLREAGLTVNVQASNPYYQDPQYMAQSNEMAQWNAMMGNGNNNNNNSFMNMMPMLMNPDGSARKDINPQMIQAMLLNSSMMDFNFNNDNNR